MLLPIFVTLFIIALDQITKRIAVMYLMPIDTFPLLKDVFHLTYVENKGAAFGILTEHRWVFMVFSVVAIVLIIALFAKYRKNMHPLLLFGLSFTVGGGIGNMIDRSVLGYVIDFFDFRLIDFAVFNVADSFICIGVGLIALDILLGKSHLGLFEDKKGKKDGEPEETELTSEKTEEKDDTTVER